MSECPRGCSLGAGLATLRPLLPSASICPWHEACFFPLRAASLTVHAALPLRGALAWLTSPLGSTDEQALPTLLP